MQDPIPADSPPAPGQLSTQDQERLNELYEEVKGVASSFVGYPCSLQYDYSPLYRFMEFSLNNVGDPFSPSIYRLNTHDIEREVIDEFTRLTHGEVDSTWGYITNGGTEGNMYGIYLGRELYPDGMVYYSEDTHYSVSKILRVLHARSIMIKSQPNGEIDYDDLRETIRIHRDVPPIIFANIGTTMKGAVDNIDTIHGIMKGLALPSYYIHVDAALSGMILPFVDEPQPFDFAARVNSISISGHKMIGSPLPCGVVLANKDIVRRIARSIEYIGTLDTTLSGSRNAITPLFLWYAFHLHGLDGLRTIVRQCIDQAEYAVNRLKQSGVDAWRHHNSNTVVFPRPSLDLIRKWQLAVHSDIAHIITMPHVNRDMIEAFIADYLDDMAQASSPTGESS